MVSQTEPQVRFGDGLSPMNEPISSSSSSLSLEPNHSQDAETGKGYRVYEKYLALFGCFLLMFNSWGLVNAYGTFSSYYQQHLLRGADPIKLNLVGSTESFIVLLLSGITGRLLDAGCYRTLTGAGWGLIAVGMFSLSGANGDGFDGEGNYGLIWTTQGLTLGLGMSCFFVASSYIVSTWFHKRKAFAIGIVACGASIAGLVYPLTTKYLIARLGFNAAVQSIAALSACTALLSFIIAIPHPKTPVRLPHRSWSHHSTWVDTHAFRRPAYVYFGVAICAMFFGFYAVFFNLEEWAAVSGFGSRGEAPMGDRITFAPDTHEREVDRDAIRTWYLLSIMNACSTVGRLSTGYLSDRHGALKVHFVVTLMAAALVLVHWTLAQNQAGAIAFVVLFGAVSGAVIGLPAASVANILAKTEGDMSKLGHWTGMMYTMSAPFALTGPVIAGHLLQRYGKNISFISAQLWSGFCLLLSAVMMFVALYQLWREEGWEGTFVEMLGSAANSMVFWRVRSGDEDANTVVETSAISSMGSTNEKNDEEKAIGQG